MRPNFFTLPVSLQGSSDFRSSNHPQSIRGAPPIAGLPEIGVWTAQAGYLVTQDDKADLGGASPE
jgi:hypothetical protein